MATAIFDLDLQQLPSKLTIADEYDQVFVLFRLKGKPVGRIWVPVINNQITETELRDAAIETVGSNLWEYWLHNYLAWDETPITRIRLPLATVAVCTRDRPDDVHRCLTALQQLPDDGQELLVIDNCPSSDATQQVVERFAGVRYVREERPGLNVARNRALREAKHDIVAFTDDDAAPDPAWLRSLLQNFDDSMVLCVTGLVMPLELETEAQEWFERYSSFSKGFKRQIFESTKQNPLATGRVGAGASMALRKQVLQWVGPFDEHLDAGTPTCSGGDHELFARILMQGYRIVYDPAALSWHRHRRTWEELQRALYGYGVGVYAFWTRMLLIEKEWTMLKIALDWLRCDQIPHLYRSLLKQPGSVPLDLIMAELSGCLNGPSAYLKSRQRSLAPVISNLNLPNRAYR
jgi:glycosyltransferase involved in cell wall biosynthesis